MSSYTESCKDCGKTIYWVEDLGCWYHWNQADMLTCPAAKIEPAGMFDTLTPGERRELSHKMVGWLSRFGEVGHVLARVALASGEVQGDLWDRRERYLEVTHELHEFYRELAV